MNITKEYKVVNEMLAMFGETPVIMPSTGSDRVKLEFLLDAYAEKLKAANPQYRMFKDNRMIPDMIVMYIVKLLGRTK